MRPRARLARPESLALAGLIGAVYSASAILLAPISFGPVQVRIPEALAVLPYLIPRPFRAFTGRLIANLAGGYGIVDAALGSGHPAAAMVSARMPNAWLASRRRLS